MKRLNKKRLWTGRFIAVDEIAYLDRRGNERVWESITRVGSSGVVVIVPITKDNEFILIRQYRAVLDRYIIEFPAGLVAEGEAPLEAGRRELIEETGYEPESVEILADGVVSTGINAEKWDVVLAKGAHPADGKLIALHPPDDTEEIEVLFAPAGGVWEFLDSRKESGDLIDLRIYGFVELALRR